MPPTLPKRYVTWKNNAFLLKKYNAEIFKSKLLIYWKMNVIQEKLIMYYKLTVILYQLLLFSVVHKNPPLQFSISFYDTGFV